MLLGEGLDNVFARHERWAAGVRAAVAAWRLPIAVRRPGAALAGADRRDRCRPASTPTRCAA